MPIVVIPARMGSTRLPNKITANIHGTPMVIRVWQQACKAEIGRVLIAAGDQEICDLASQYGAESVLTDSNISTGTDRVWQALERLKDKTEEVILLQGDLPLINPGYLQKLAALLSRSEVEYATLATPITDGSKVHNPNRVKIAFTQLSPELFKAVYFSRTPIPYNAKTYLEHVGIYGFKRKFLRQFVGWTRGTLEQQEQLEQLRAIEKGIPCYFAMVPNSPYSVDTIEDLEKVRELAEASAI